MEKNREEKSLRHVAKVAKFLHAGQQTKTSLKMWIRTVSDVIDLIQFHLVGQMMANFSGLNRKGPAVFQFRKRKRKLLCCVHLLIQTLLTCQMLIFSGVEL